MPPRQPHHLTSSYLGAFSKLKKEGAFVAISILAAIFLRENFVFPQVSPPWCDSEKVVFR